MTLPAWLTAPPETSQGVWAWFLALFIAYMLSRKTMARLRGSTAATTMARLSDAATFAGSFLLLVGVVHPATLRAVGDTTVFLVIAGAGGVLYGLEQVWAEDGDG